MAGRQHERQVMRAIAGVAGLAAALTFGGGLLAQAVGLPPAGAPMAPVAPVAISRLGGADGTVAVRGRVAEIFGSRFILDDGTGRALIETGPRGEEAGLVAPGVTVTAQGIFAHGALRAMLLTDAAGKVTPLAGGGHDGRGRRGPERSGRAGPPDGPCGPGNAPPPPA